MTTTTEPEPLDETDSPESTDAPDVRYALPWHVATVAARRRETSSAVSLELDVPGWHGALPGQHVDVRLTAEDGYSTQRSYSLACPGTMGVARATMPTEATTARIALTVQVVEDGEVSPYLAEELVVGDQIELRGPIGHWFVWQPRDPQPVQLVGGGSGLVPLMSMVRTRHQAGSRAPFRLLTSVRTPADALYAAELDALASQDPGLEVTWAWTRQAPAGWTGPVGRLDADALAAACLPPEQHPHVFVCGPTPFVEHVASTLVSLGHDADRIRTERFGPTG
ncbi:ferredoxin reductase [Cellulomonas soli]|uniref:Oxidoreductase n=1 Tax=Cellulomonas soli TaxID=931535 RepID=A0A512PDG1_9CELL|nr:ferredoxin reductase [Cellulomonas soli]NYI60103.1 ferredoxin-NADP reductase [Cellulomonas soli]GEP69244.1 oxidoreductase [Cellulomonas soli]